MMAVAPDFVGSTAPVAVIVSGLAYFPMPIVTVLLIVEDIVLPRMGESPNLVC
jgi:hypothetical protein